MNKIKNTIISATKGKPIVADVFYKEDSKAPVIIYAHGFNGFKDWGNFDLIAEQFVNEGFTFIKFNFSHNGTSHDHPEEFVDLEAYSQNNYTTELNDLNLVINWTLSKQNPAFKSLQPDQLFLLGHSMGGGIVLVQAAEDSRVKAVVTWASVGALTTPWGKWTQDRIDQWQSNRVDYIRNGRTGQDMPLGYQLYEDYEANKERLDVERAIKRIRVPVLLCHGHQDEAVPAATASRLASLNDQATIFFLDTDHVFGRRHPMERDYLPQASQQLVDRTTEFLKQVTVAGC